MSNTILRILNELESVKTNDKKAILKRETGNDTLQLVFDYAYNPTKTYGIQMKTIPDLPETFSDKGMDLAEGLKSLDVLVDRKVTGHDALRYVNDLFNELTGDDAEVLRRVILKDLECNTGSTLAKNVWGSRYEYKPPQMLASSQSDKSIEWLVKNSTSLSAELKADGARCFVDLCNKTMFTRNYKYYNDLTQLQEVLFSMPAWCDYVIDGELVVDSTKAERSLGNGLLNKSLNGKIEQSDADLIRYQVWDIIPRDVYYGNAPSVMPLRERRELLERFCEECNSRYDEALIQIIEATPVKDIAEAKRVYHDYVNRGFEGIILKDLDGVWENKRSKRLVKFKEKYRVDVKVVATYPHKKDPSKLGGLTIESECGKLRCNVGSGLRDKTTAEDIDSPMDSLDKTTLMTHRDELIGRIVELECNGLIENTKTVGKDGHSMSLFLPIIKLWRHDKGEANDLENIKQIMNLND